MNITIQIECETIQDFYSHLGELRKQIKKKTKELKLDFWKDQFPESVDLNDDNCYGCHYVEIDNSNF